MRRGLLRTTPRLLCTVLQDALTQVQKVWNLDFAGTPTTEELRFHEKPVPSAPLYHIMDLEGNVRNTKDEPALTKETATRIMETMLRQRTIDRILLEAQRQGRISFYMTSFGEEGSVTACAAALRPDDEVFMQYRECSLLTYRGYTVAEMIAQCMGNVENEMKGRQMPIHYGSRSLHVQMVSSPLATQIPHAAGAGYAFRLENERATDPAARRIVTVFFGEGAASEGDFHAGLNFAATMGSNALFFVRNNGYAISTPTRSQYRGDGILGRGLAYGMPAARVDGHDVLAVLRTVQKARELILETNQPVLIEVVTYRVSHHSTSDDSTAYRSRDEIEYFAETFSPIARFQNYLVKKDWWSPAQSEAVVQQAKKETLHELRRQENIAKWPVAIMHDDVYKELTPEMRQAQRELEEHYERNRETYDASHH